MKTLISKLDLHDYVTTFETFFARQKPLFMEGDSAVHYRFITELDEHQFQAPPKVQPLENELAHLARHGVLHPEQIFEFVKIIRYFEYLRTLRFVGRIKEWLDEIIIPAEITRIAQDFNDKGEIKDEVDERLVSLTQALDKNRQSARTAFHKAMNDSRLSAYLVDRQAHFINGEEAMMVRGGFNHVLRGRIVGRTQAGFFYVVPASVSEYREQEAQILSARADILYEYAKKVSAVLAKSLLFLKFIGRAFDRFDHYQARVCFARAKDGVFLLPRHDKKIILKEFCHPAILHPKPLTIDFSAQIMMVTGVNAGGKTMLLKSILSAVFLSKYLLPMRVDPAQSQIGTFGGIEAVIDDPQNVKNDISTFAGRMKEFARLFTKKDMIVGVDEIELGTDADEAASLFKVILENLVKKETKIVITTHHKRLAALMAGHETVELVAALYDEENRQPTYEFLQGSIGKSYAFETAMRYGIPHNVVQEARVVYGEDKERLNELIERSSVLERTLMKKKDDLDHELEAVKRLKDQLKEEREEQAANFAKTKADFQRDYNTILNEARQAIKASDTKDIHRALGKAAQEAKALRQEQGALVTPPSKSFKVGDHVRYGNSRGVIVALSGKNATVEVDGIKLKVDVKLLKESASKGLTPTAAKKGRVVVERPEQASIMLDLHGLRADEAIEKLDKFLSDALIAGYEELLIYHGIGSGKLAFAVKEFLSGHPSIVDFGDAPANMGGYGAKVVHI